MEISFILGMVELDRDLWFIGEIQKTNPESHFIVALIVGARKELFKWKGLSYSNTLTYTKSFHATTKLVG
jgi:hypothetical protein